MVVITITRAPGVETKVTLTAKLSVPATNSDELVTDEWEIEITILPGSDLDVPRGTIGEILEIVHPDSDPSNKADKLDVNLENVTIFARGEGSVVFGYDGTGIIQLFGTPANIEVGKVYNISGLLEWYFGIWEIIDPVGTEVPNATPEYPTQENITDISQVIDGFYEDGLHQSAYGSVADGNFEPIYAKVTGTVFMTGTGNYNTFLMDSDFNEATPGVPGNLDDPAKGFMFYYGTNGFTDIRDHDGFEVIIDVVIYTYRSNNHAWAVYFVGEEIGLGELTNEQKVDLDLSALRTPLQVFEEEVVIDDLKTLEGENGSTISWVVDKEAVINKTTGEVTLTTERTTVKLTATVSVPATDEEDAVTKTKVFEIEVGPLEDPETISKANGRADGWVSIIEGVVTGQSGNRAITIEDETGATVLYGNNFSELEEDEIFKIGDTVKIQGTRATYNGLRQFTNYEVLSVTAGNDTVDAVNINKVQLDHTSTTSSNPLFKHQSQLVTLQNVIVTKVETDDFNNTTLTLTRADAQTITLRWDSRVDVANNNLGTIKEGDLVNIIAAPLSWNNGPVIGFNSNTQVVVRTNANIKATVEALSGLEFKFEYAEDEKLTLSDKLTFEFVETDQSAVFNLETGQITAPVAKVVVELKVTAQLEPGLEYSRTFEFYVGEKWVPITIAEAAAKEKGEQVIIVGVVTGFTDYVSNFGNFDKVWLEDATGAIVVYRGAFAPDLKIGDEYAVVGSIDNFNGLIQVGQGAITQKQEYEGEDLPAIKTVEDVEDLVDVKTQGTRINITGEVVTISGNGRDVTIKVGGENISIRTNYSDDKHPVNAQLLTAKVGDTIKLTGVHVDWFNGAQLNPTLASQIEVTPAPENPEA